MVAVPSTVKLYRSLFTVFTTILIFSADIVDVELGQLHCTVFVRAMHECQRQVLVFMTHFFRNEQYDLVAKRKSVYPKKVLLLSPPPFPPDEEKISRPYCAEEETK